jgi:hypothetical protein
MQLHIGRSVLAFVIFRQRKPLQLFAGVVQAKDIRAGRTPISNS